MSPGLFLVASTALTYVETVTPDDEARRKLNRQRARIGGLANAAKNDTRETTAKARRAAESAFMERADPTGELRKTNPAEAARREQAERKKHFAKMALASAQARRKRAA